MKEKLIGKKYLPHRTVIGFVLGIIAGLLFKDFSVWVLPFGTAFMNLIKMLIVPVIFFSLVSGISAIGDVNRLKRVGMKIVATYVVMTAVSCFIGIAVVSITHPGAGFDTSVLTAYDPSNLTTPSFGGFLLGMIPTNIVSSMANQDIMQMVFFTMILAIALVIVGEKAKVVTEFMNQSANVIYKMLDIIMIYSPIGVFALMANTTAVYGAQLFGNLAKFVLTDYISCLLAWFAFSIFIKYYTGIRYGRMCKAMVPKVGYIYISIDSCRGTVGDMDCLVIDSPEELLDKLLYEMAVDIMEEGGHDLNPVEASALERAEVARRLNVYLEQLPEYQDRISFIFERK